MSTSIAAPVTRPVVAVLPVDEPGEHPGRPPVAERDESQDLPEGALVWLAQLQPLPEPLSRPATGLKQARGGAPEKASVATAPIVSPMPGGVTVKGPLAAKDGASMPMQVAGAMAVPALAQSLTGPARAVPATPAMPLPVSDVPRLPGNGSAALAESPGQPVPANALQGLAISASPTPMAQPGAEPASTLTDSDAPPPQSAQQLPPGLERTARAQAAPQAAFNPPPTGKPEMSAEKAAQPYLQVPFSKGDITGVVTIQKAPADMPQQLLLSPSNAQVSGHLRDGLELAPQTIWQLNEQHEQAHDEHRQHHAGDDEPQDDAPQPLARMLAVQGMQP